MTNYFFNSFNLIAKLSQNFINFAIADRTDRRRQRRGLTEPTPGRGDEGGKQT